MMRNPTGYSALQITLHWAIAALIAFQLFVHDGMSDAFDDLIDGDEVRGDEMTWAVIHIVVGVTVLALATIRLLLRWRRGVPAPHRDKPVALIWLGNATHYALYALMFYMPLTGALAWFVGWDDAADAHELGRSLLFVVVGLHVLGALGEHFVFRNDTLIRMLVPRG